MLKDDSLSFYFYEACKLIGVEIHENEISKFFMYKDLLISWNKKMNLTAIIDDEQVILKHFVDSLTILEFIERGAKVIDVGTGAGFPGLPLRMMREDIEITLLDSLRKRILFLEDVVDKLGLTSVKLLQERAENAGQNNAHREKYDIAVSRAVAPLPILAEYCLPFVKKGGIFLAMKGAAAQEEIIAASDAVAMLGGEIKGTKLLSLNDDDNYRNIIKISKAENTPVIYPRKTGKPSKSPLSKNVNKKW